MGISLLKTYSAAIATVTMKVWCCCVNDHKQRSDSASLNIVLLHKPVKYCYVNSFIYGCCMAIAIKHGIRKYFCINTTA